MGQRSAARHQFDERINIEEVDFTVAVAVAVGQVAVGICGPVCVRVGDRHDKWVDIEEIHVTITVQVARQRDPPEVRRGDPSIIGAQSQFTQAVQRVDAREALEIGLVNSVCDKNELLGECQKMAAMICETGPIAIEQAKHAINHGLETDLQTGLAIESDAYWITVPTEDRLEGLAAFREKRKPVYKGK